ncbi:uncharacterized protein LOC122397284 isoform X1 [Colletes gigas]|uniref:uncharacterized protein LOC122397284 isoform X1 n=1 Tax=Colletes gigas TaxID=935657 RepID=UPI001C9B6C88|nr:uncharacterized protein LOC122397284 isoform X1 [Colletes gigas]
MPSAEEDHDHDLRRHTCRCSGHHRRWILWTVNAEIRTVQRRRRRVRKCEPSAASVPRQVGPKRKKSRRFKVERSPSSAWSTSTASTVPSQQSSTGSASITAAASSTNTTSTLAAPRLASIVAEFVLLLLESRLSSARRTTRTTRPARRTKNRRCCRCRCLHDRLLSLSHCADLDEIVVIPVSFRSAFNESANTRTASVAESRPVPRARDLLHQKRRWSRFLSQLNNSYLARSALARPLDGRPSLPRSRETPPVGNGDAARAPSRGQTNPTAAGVASSVHRNGREAVAASAFARWIGSRRYSHERTSPWE